jgi:hypothetical protein
LDGSLHLILLNRSLMDRIFINGPQKRTGECLHISQMVVGLLDGCLQLNIAEITNTTVSKNDKCFDFLRFWNQTSVEEY